MTGAGPELGRLRDPGLSWICSHSQAAFPCQRDPPRCCCAMLRMSVLFKSGLASYMFPEGTFGIFSSTSLTFFFPLKQTHAKKKKIEVIDLAQSLCLGSRLSPPWFTSKNSWWIYEKGHKYLSLIFSVFYLLWIISWNLGVPFPK